METREAPTFRTIWGRIVRLTCPVCGKGSIFRRFFLRAERCSHCDWHFERGEGHWVGGSEVHMFASYGLSVLVCIPILVLVGNTALAMGGVILGHVILSVVLFRYSRAIFLGLDYLVDPAPPPQDGRGGDGSGEPARPRTPLSPRRRRGRREKSSDRVREVARL